MSADDAPPSVRATPRPGDTIDGKYALLHVLGKGGMGVVFEAEHLRLHQRCAIKMLLPEALRDLESLHRFEREARAAALLKSPHVARVTDVATTAQGAPYIVMELLAGHDLDAELQSRGALPVPEAVDYVLQACAAVNEAHAAGIIHRDLKPGNLFLARQEERSLVKVLDFGISKMIEEETKLTSVGISMGTVAYMSPEQVRSAAKVDAQADIWSLGVILYELLCGALPFTGNAMQLAAAIVSEDVPPIAKRCAIPAELGAAIHRALRRSPAERFANVAELAAALVPFAPPDSIGAAVAAQISRRSSHRELRLEPDRSSDRHVGARVDVDANARTLPHEVPTSAPHEVDTVARPPSARRPPFIAALTVIAVVATLTAAALGVTVLRRPPPSPEGATAAGSIGLSTATPPSAPASGTPAPISLETTPAASASLAAPVGSTARPTASIELASAARGSLKARPTRSPPAAATKATTHPTAKGRPAPPTHNPPFLN